MWANILGQGEFFSGTKGKSLAEDTKILVRRAIQFGTKNTCSCGRSHAHGWRATLEGEKATWRLLCCLRWPIGPLAVRWAPTPNPSHRVCPNHWGPPRWADTGRWPAPCPRRTPRRFILQRLGGRWCVHCWHVTFPGAKVVLHNVVHQASFNPYAPPPRRFCVSAILGGEYPQTA